MEREGRQLEYKEYLTNYKNLYRTVVAFANDLGGKIIIGVRDKDRKVVGLSEEQVDLLLEELPRAIYDAITPYCIPQICTRLIDDKFVIELVIHSGDRKPYFIKAEGIPRGVYLRIGAHNKRVSPELLEDLMREGSRCYWDEEPVMGFDMDILDDITLKSFYGKTWSTQQLIADKVIVLNSQTGQKQVTNSGVIYFSKEPQRFCNQAEVLFSHFAGEDMKKINKTVDLSAPLPILAKQVIDLISPHITLEQKQTGLTLEQSEFEIPFAALREIILNALIHRKYSINDAIKVALFSDRLEVFSPGNFPGPIDLSELGNGVSYARNPHLRQLARKNGLVEKRGMGFRIILDECKRNRNPKPLIEEGADYVKVTLFRNILETDTSVDLPEKYKALEYLRSANQRFQTREAAELLNVSIGTARTRLYELIEQGFLRHEGQGRGTWFYWL